jgi:hypothetical protein
MGPWIHQAKTKMVSIVEGVRIEHPLAMMKVAFVGYRDYGDTERHIVIPFMGVAETMASIQNVNAEGGDDTAEDVAHGLFNALHQDWTGANVKLVFHIADAPPHGMDFHHPRVSDRFPSGDPDGLDPRDTIERMSFLDIHFTFVQIDSSTDIMMEEFNNCYTQGGTFTVVDLRPQCTRYTFDQTLTRSISDSITEYTSSQAL